MKKQIVNLNIIISLIIFFIISILSIYTTIPFLKQSLSNLYLKQIIFYFFGILIMLFIKYKGFDLLKRYHFLVYIGLNILLLFLLIFGYSINGSKCWIIIGPISFQPSELMKISLIITLSMVIKKHEGKNSIKEEFVLLVKLFILTLIPSILTFLEPDTGAVIIYFLILLTMIFLTKLNKKWYLIISLIIIFLLSCITILYFFKKDFILNILTNNMYRLERIINWQENSGYQLENSLIAISNSGLTGFGYNKNIIYFPEPQTDFIFPTFVANFGLLGSIFLIFIILVFDATILNLIKIKIDLENKYILVGIFIMLFYLQIQNIGMTLGLLPITGIPLPFISYGGSSLITYLFSLGIILNINKTRDKYLN